MIANKRLISTLLVGAIVWSFSVATLAVDAHTSTKVNNAKARAWSKEGNPHQDPALQKEVVNFGSRKNNTCNVNVGTVKASKHKAGEKAPKDIVVTTDTVINVCK